MKKQKWKQWINQAGKLCENCEKVKAEVSICSCCVALPKAVEMLQDAMSLIEYLQNQTTLSGPVNDFVRTCVNHMDFVVGEDDE